MRKIPDSVSVSSPFPVKRDSLPWPVGRTVATTLQDCGCESTTIRAVRSYLRENFPGWAVRDFHERTRLIQVGSPVEYADHHVVSVTDWEQAYYAVLPIDLCEHPLPSLRERLRHWQLADLLRVHAILIVSRAGVAAL